MVGFKLSAGAQLRIEVLTEARRKFDRMYSLVEQYGAAKAGEDAIMSSLARTATDVARVFMNNGYGIMADTANQIGMLAKRGAGKQMKLRALREFIVSARQAMEHAEKMIIEEDKKAHGEEQASAGG